MYDVQIYYEVDIDLKAFCVDMAKWRGVEVGGGESAETVDMAANFFLAVTENLPLKWKHYVKPFSPWPKTVKLYF